MGVQEIQTAIEALSPDEYSDLSRWLGGHDSARWDEQMYRDSDGGKLDFLFSEVKGR